MDLREFDIAGHFKVSLPMLIRKVDRAGHWGNATDILENVFPVDDDGTISLWRIDGIDDLIAVSVAMNANRVSMNPNGASLTEPLRLVAIRQEEFGDIEVTCTPGQTDCVYARQRHFNAIIVNPGSLGQLVNRLLAAGRAPANLTKAFLKSALEHTTMMGCHAVVTSEICSCESVG